MLSLPGRAALDRLPGARQQHKEPVASRLSPRPGAQGGFDDTVMDVACIRVVSSISSKRASAMRGCWLSWSDGHDGRFRMMPVP